MVRRQSSQTPLSSFRTRSITSSGSTVARMSSTNDRSEAGGSANSALSPGGSQKTPRLAGFDPFLPGTFTEPTTPRLSQKKREVKPPFPESPRISTPDERNDGALASVRLEQLQNELRAIASQLEQDSPRRQSSTPPPEKKIQRSPRGGTSRIFSPFTKKLGHHRKTKSLDANKQLWKEVQEREANLARPSSVDNRSVSTATVPSPSTRNNGDTTCSTPPRDAAMLQEVWMQQSTNDSASAAASTNSSLYQSNTMSPTTVTANSPGVESLYIPSLAKPRPTSFLTGQDVVRTSEYDATKWQLEIPAKKDFLVASKVSQFLDTYRSNECLLDLQSLVGYSRLELSQFANGSKFCSVKDIADCHRPIVESLLDCGDDIVEVRGYWHTQAQQDLDQRREVLVLERQRQFLVVMRGTVTEQQQSRSQRQSETVSLKEGHDITVFADAFRAVQELEKEVYARLDELTEATPFCDVVFAGHSFGASMATLAAYLYAYTRSDQRVSALVTGSPKVGLTDFRWSVHASPNLKVMRVEYGNSSSRGGGGGTSAQHARHVGHTIRLCKQQQGGGVKAYKFGTGPVDSRGARSFLFKRERDVGEYVQAFEALPTWVTDYYKEDGAGVRGKDNEARQMV